MHGWRIDSDQKLYLRLSEYFQLFTKNFASQENIFPNIYNSISVAWVLSFYRFCVSDARSNTHFSIIHIIPGDGVM